MPAFRMTIRWGSPGQRYHVEDLEAQDLSDALQRAAALFPDAARATADLVEIRLHARTAERADPD